VGPTTKIARGSLERDFDVDKEDENMIQLNKKSGFFDKVVPPLRQKNSTAKKMRQLKQQAKGARRNPISIDSQCKNKYKHL
jgi:hypothetical protein